MKTPVGKFLLRWLVCSLGLFIAAGFLSSSINYGHEAHVLIIGGFILAIINIVLKPIIVVFSLPAILFSLGLFMVIVNGVTVYLASVLYRPLHVNSFWSAVFAGIVIGLVNYLVTAIVEERNNDSI
ncbi:MAG TPA: phage holin family protein [Candidatus Saccharimonadales bacterium]|nr:phage holin family protein [Candidatus Saccharimonadales bacterium]